MESQHNAAPVPKPNQKDDPGPSQEAQTPRTITFAQFRQGEDFRLYRGQHPDGSFRIGLSTKEVGPPPYLSIADFSEHTLKELLSRDPTVYEVLTAPSQGRWWLYTTLKGHAEPTIDLDQWPQASCTFHPMPQLNPDG